MKLVTIQNELKAPKGQTNKFGGYQYRSCEDILEALKPILKTHNCALTISDDMIQLGERYYVKATAKLLNCDDKSEFHEVSAFAREAPTKKGMDEAQITGSASSYARKYALNGLFAIDDTKDADTQDNSKEGAAPRKEAQPKQQESVTTWDAWEIPFKNSPRKGQTLGAMVMEEALDDLRKLRIYLTDLVVKKQGEDSYDYWCKAKDFATEAVQAAEKQMAEVVKAAEEGMGDDSAPKPAGNPDAGRDDLGFVVPNEIAHGDYGNRD